VRSGYFREGVASNLGGERILHLGVASTSIGERILHRGVAASSYRATTVAIVRRDEQDFISLTEMLRAKKGDFFVGDWLRNRNTMEFLGVWERVHNPNLNCGEFATIRGQADAATGQQVLERDALHGRELPRLVPR